MLRLVQTSDIRLGARHLFLGERASDQRERQFEALDRTVELALETPADLFLVAGDLFDSSTLPRAAVERTAGSLRKLVAADIPVVLIPGPRDAPGGASIYHAHDIAGLVGEGPGAGTLVVLGGDAPEVDIPTLKTRVTTRFPADNLPEEGWRIGLIHSVTRPRDDEIAAAGVDYLAIGGPIAAATGRAATVTWGASGAPELVDIERDGLGEVLVVTLDESAGRPTVERQRVGRTRFERLELDLAGLADQAGLVKQVGARADPDLVLDVRLTGDWRDDLELDPEAAETALEPRFLRLRIRNSGRPTLTTGALPPPDTIAGAFLRDLEARIAEVEAVGDGETADELREALRLGRRLLAGQGTGG
jgi:Calcineurin-like phosphoesterase